jgi:hypothetical protein
MKIIKKVAKQLLLLFVIIQFFRPDKNSNQGDHLAGFINETNPTEEVKVILAQSCYDCHSNHTKYPWYNNVAPVSFLISSHIRQGKENLNLSDWDSYTRTEKNHKLEEIIEVTEDDKMPLMQYAWIHPEARLTREQKEAILEWARQTKALYGLGRLPR